MERAQAKMPDTDWQIYMVAILHILSKKVLEYQNLPLFQNSLSRD